MGPLPGGQSYEAKNAPVRLMIERVYHIIDNQISGGPGWMNTELYDIEAKAERPSSLDQLHEMFQDLLAERFKLQFHRETRQLPVYALTVDKNGPKPRLKVNDSADEFSGRIGPNIVGPLSRLPGMTCVGIPMSALSWTLAMTVGRPVLDETGLKGYYDFKLEWTSASEQASVVVKDGDVAPPSVEGPTIFRALPEQLGLKLDARKGPVEVFVIDHVERPTAN